MPVGLAVNELIEEVVVFDGGVVARFSTSNPPVTLVVPAFCILVTTATDRLGSTAMAVGGPLVGTSCTAGVPGVDSNSGVRSIAETLLPPLLAVIANARS